MTHDELKICGLPAVRARFERDPASIVRLFCDLATSRQIAKLLKTLAEARKVYRCVEPAELEKISGSLHHGGIVAVVTGPVSQPVAPADLTAWARAQDSLLILDRIGNAHNLGALARTAAFFGVPRLIITDEPGAARPNDAAYRVAEGGFEWLTVHRVRTLPLFLRDLAAAGYEVIGAATRSSAPGGRASAGRASPAPKFVARALVMGNEEHGLAAEVTAACTRLETLPGTGKVESLNVSVAGAILIWEHLRSRANQSRATR
jgi:TrmH RNA methyltransferase